MSVGTTLVVGFDGKAVKRGLAGLSDSFKGLGNATAGVSKFAAGVGAIAVGGAVAVGALAFKINAIGEEARASDERLRNIAKSMGIFGNEAGTVADRLLELADTQGRLLGIDDDTIALTQAKLLTFKELAKSADTVGGAFDRATMAALNMSAAGFGEAESNAVSLGKALNDPIKGITALGKAGITFTESEKKVIEALVETNKIAKAQDVILKAIESQVGGTAAATATASGRIKVALAQVVEEFSKPFSTGFDGLPGAFESVFPQIIAKAAELGQTFSLAIADAVNGNFDKFISIGKLIGDIMGAAATASFQSASTGIIVNTENFLRGQIRGIAGGSTSAKGSLLPDIGGESFESLLESALINRGISVPALNRPLEAQPINRPFNDKFRYANPGEQSIYSDDKGNKLIEILSKIESNTQTGSKL